MNALVARLSTMTADEARAHAPALLAVVQCAAERHAADLAYDAWYTDDAAPLAAGEDLEREHERASACLSDALDGLAAVLGVAG